MLRLRNNSVWLVLAVAFALLVQSAVGIAAPAGVHTAPMVDAFGNPLCLNDVGHQDHGGHSKVPNCCTLGGRMFTPALGVPPTAVEIRPARVSIVSAKAALPALIWLPDPAYTPGNPRAPPGSI